jgi:hypothetical protein
MISYLILNTGEKKSGSTVPFLNLFFEDVIEVLTYAILSIREMITRLAVALGAFGSHEAVVLARPALAESRVCHQQNELGYYSKITHKIKVEL